MFSAVSVCLSLCVCLPLLIFPCTIKSRGSLLAPALLGGPGKRAVKQLCVCVCLSVCLHDNFRMTKLRTIKLGG